MTERGSAAPPDPVSPSPAVTPSRLARIERWFDRMDSVPPGERTPELMAYIARSELAVDMVALCTIWLSVLPFTPELDHAHRWWLIARIVLSLVFLVDLLIRARLSRTPWAYVRDHPFAVLTVVFPPVRVVLSVRLLRRSFQRGNLARFLGVASILLLNGALICWAFERGAPHATITSVGKSLWWAVVTVTTVGYGDVTPVTTGGRITAFAVMVLGILTLAVVTATIASRFRDQADETGFDLPPGSNLDAPTTARLIALRDGIDALLDLEGVRRTGPGGSAPTDGRD